MVPKVLVLKTGERIIAGASELTDNESGKGICLVIKCPYILSLNAKETGTDEYSVNFSKWNPFSSDNKFNIPYDSVIAVSNAEQGILDVYLEKFSAELYYEEEVNAESEVDLTEE
jgi:hypothetical protein